MFFPLSVVPVKIENKLKGHSIEKPPKYQYVILLKSPNFDAWNIKWFTVNEKSGSVVLVFLLP